MSCPRQKGHYVSRTDAPLRPESSSSKTARKGSQEVAEKGETSIEKGV